jgi:hypothetical protein
MRPLRALAELRRVLCSLGEKLSDEDVDALLANVAIDSNGCVSCEGALAVARATPLASLIACRGPTEFVNTVMSG